MMKDQTITLDKPSVSNTVGVSNTVIALSSAAAAALGTFIPAMSHAAAAADKVQVDLRYSQYQESDIDAAKLSPSSTGDGERMTIDILQGRSVIPLGSGFDLSLTFAYEDLSGASPWYVEPRDVSGGDFTPVVNMTGATIEDTRTDIAVGLNYTKGDYVWSTQAGISTENDYESVFLGGGVSTSFNKKHTSLNLGFAIADDTVEPSNPEDDVAYQAPSAANGGFAVGRIPDADKKTYSAFAGVTQVINRYSTLEMALGYKYSDGYLSDPYKKAHIQALVVDSGFGSSTVTRTVSDTRPDERSMTTFSVRYREFIPAFNGAMHLNYRYYDDDWEVESHTLEALWYQNFVRQWQLVPGIRWYSQSEAGFYEPYYLTARRDRLASSDYRLSGYGALTYEISLNKQIGRWRFLGLYEYYDTSEKFGHDASETENPGLVDFSRFSLGFDYSF